MVRAVFLYIRSISDTHADEEDIMDNDDDSEESFHYPASPSSSVRPTSIRSHTTDYFSRPSTSRTTTDLTPQLSQAPEFRVPTHESPQNILTPRTTLIPHSMDAQWEKDENATTCRGCNRRFTFLFRKVCYRVLCVDAILTKEFSMWVYCCVCHVFILIFASLFFIALQKVWSDILRPVFFT